VVWHVANENIPDAQVQSQIDVLNQDYRMTNADIGQVPAVWTSRVGDARVVFALATTDPSGNPTNGITRTQTNTAAFAQLGNPVKSAAAGGADPWPADRYLNMWVCPLGDSLLGYAQFPGGPPETDGVVILHSGFGTTGTAAAPFDRGRTATHEVGHWLNLFHIWGDDGTGCNGTDEVSDTPNAAGPNFGCPTFPRVTCSNGPDGDMFMNYMDYTNDACMFMFTAGQVTRMQAALDGPRASIGSAATPATSVTTVSAAHDLTGDGRADVVGFGDAGMYVALNDGNGTFQPLQLAIDNFGYIAGGWRVEKHPRFLADLTGDAAADTAGFGDAGMYVALNDGNGTFQPLLLAIDNFGYTAGGWRVEKHPRLVVGRGSVGG
jgi:hypothetical protein